MSERTVRRLCDLDLRREPENRWVNRCIVANGCFDILHPGHISLLEKLDQIAYEQRLHPIVAINSDESIKRLKGDRRPVVPEMCRASVLTNLRWAFTVIIFDEDTPWLLMDLLEPKIVMKGMQYANEPIVKHRDSDVILVPMVDGWSTTSIIDG